MKWILPVIAILLLTLAIAGVASAKIDVRNKNLDASAAMAQQAKMTHQNKAFLLQHQEMMEKVSSQYEAVQKDVQSGNCMNGQGLRAKAYYNFYYKARHQSGYKHDCPYRKGMPN